MPGGKMPRENGGSAWESNPPNAGLTGVPAVLKTVATTRCAGTSERPRRWGADHGAFSWVEGESLHSTTASPRPRPADRGSRLPLLQFLFGRGLGEVASGDD